MEQCARCKQRYRLAPGNPARCPACGFATLQLEPKSTPTTASRPRVAGYAFALSCMVLQAILYGLLFLATVALARPCDPARFLDLFCGVPWATPVTLAMSMGIVLATLLAMDNQRPSGPRNFQLASAVAWFCAMSSFLYGLIRYPASWDLVAAFALLFAFPALGTFWGARSWRRALLGLRRE